MFGWPPAPLLRYPESLVSTMSNGCLACSCRCKGMPFAPPYNLYARPTESNESCLPVIKANEGNIEQPIKTVSREVPLILSQNLIPSHNHHLTYIFSKNFSLPTSPHLRSSKNQQPKDKVILFENNYKYRNVYKSIIRRMSANIQENKKQLTDFLIGMRFTLEDIEHAYSKVLCSKDTERKSGNKKMGPKLINDAVKDVTVYTYILKEALERMLNDWEDDKLGKVSKKNIETYKKVCIAYYEKVKKLLNNE